MMFFVFCVLLPFISSYNNGVGKTPAMGWNSWNQFGCDVSETLILDTMNGMKKYGLDKVGYKYVNIDDCWQLKDRDPKTGQVVPDPDRFPNGIASLADQIHQNGLNLGLYTDIGKETCQGRAGSYDYYDIDAQTYADWKIDYIKVDYCHTTTKEVLEPWKFYGNFSNYINETGRHILFSVCNWGKKDPWKWAPSIANSWRTTGDISPTYFSVLDNMEKTEKLSKYAGLYNLGVVKGSDQLTMVENKAHFSLWSLLAAPLLLGNDLRNISSEILEIITNEEVISINQDELGKQGKIVKSEKEWYIFGACFPIHEGWCKNVEIWQKELSGGRYAVGLFNVADAREENSKYFKDELIEVTWKELGLEDDDVYSIRDVWNHTDLGKFSKEFKSPEAVGQHDIFVFIMTPA